MRRNHAQPVESFVFFATIVVISINTHCSSQTILEIQSIGKYSSTDFYQRHPPSLAHCLLAVVQRAATENQRWRTMILICFNIYFNARSLFVSQQFGEIVLKVWRQAVVFRISVNTLPLWQQTYRKISYIIFDKLRTFKWKIAENFSQSLYTL